MNWPRRLPYIVGIAALVAWPVLFSSPYDLRVFTLAGIYAILVIGYQFIFGQVGALSLAQGALFGLGAFVTGILATRYGLPFLVTFALSILTPVALAALVAAPVLRLGSHYFALATLGIAQVVLLIAIKWESVTGGANGLSGVPGIVILGSELSRGVPVAVAVWTCVALAALVAWQINRGLYGRRFHLLRTNAVAAASVGVDTARLRFGAFLLSALFAGMAGALHAHTLRVVSPEVLEFHVMVACLAMAIVGGRARIVGAVLGAFLLVHLPEWFRFLDGAYLIAYGVIMLAMIIVAPDGLIGLFESIWERWVTAPLVSELSLVKSLPGTRRPAAADEPVLSLQGVSKSFGGIRALSDIVLQLRVGEILGLIGPNGSGKTTLINVITGVYAADSGHVRLDRTDITGAHPFRIARAGVARTFQAAALVDDMTALDNVALACAPGDDRGVWRRLLSPAVELSHARGTALALLDQLGLSDRAAVNAGRLKQGEKRRAEIARALATRPLVLLLDEPAAGLNVQEQVELADRLKEIAKAGPALIIVEHNMPFLMRVAERVACLEAGKLIAIGTPAEIRSNPSVVAAYLGTELVSAAPS